MKIIRLILAACIAAIASCTAVKESETTTKPDGTVTQKDSAVVAVGGKGAHRQGQGTIWNNEKNMGQLIGAATTAATGYFAFKGYEAQQVTEQVTIKAATKQRAIDANASVAKERIAASVEKAQIHATTPTQ